MPKSSKDEVKSCESKILSKLKNNSTISDLKLSEEMGYSRQKIWRIKKNMEDNKIIWGYSTIINEKKRGRIPCVILINRTSAVIDDEKANHFISKGFKDMIEKYDIDVETIISTHGMYDWILIIHAGDIVSIRNFLTELKIYFHESIKDIVMLESATAIKKCWIMNPEIEHKKRFLKSIL